MPSQPPTLSLLRRCPWAAVVVVFLIPLIFLPTLAIRFDFDDDGLLVYRKLYIPKHTVFLHAFWQKTVTEFHSRGPFRPISWANWVAAANWLGPVPLLHRWIHLIIALLSVAAFAWWLRELRIPWPAVLLVTALGFWNPVRSEIWIGLAQSEAYAMPYAMLAMICAIRAARHSRSWGWDLLGIVCLLLAMGVKNTFAVMVPVTLFLRATAGGLPLREGLRRHWFVLLAMSATLALPVTHFILFKLNPQPLEYKTAWAPLQLPRMVRSVAHAAGLEYVALGLLFAVLACRVPRSAKAEEPNSENGPLLWPALGTGTLLLVLGIGIYLPMDGVSGRYTIPAVWGTDLFLALAVSRLLQAESSRWKTYAKVSLAGCLLILAITTVGKEWKRWARIDVCWQTLEYLEQNAPPGARVEWVGTEDAAPGLDFSVAEGIHFCSHVANRGRRTDLSLISVRLPDSALSPSAEGRQQPDVILCGPPSGVEQAGWKIVKRFRSSYWAGARSFECYLMARTSTARRSGD